MIHIFFKTKTVVYLSIHTLRRFDAMYLFGESYRSIGGGPSHNFSQKKSTKFFFSLVVGKWCLSFFYYTTMIITTTTITLQFYELYGKCVTPDGQFDRQSRYPFSHPPLTLSSPPNPLSFSRARVARCLPKRLWKSKHAMHSSLDLSWLSPPISTLALFSRTVSESKVSSTYGHFHWFDHLSSADSSIF